MSQVMGFFLSRLGLDGGRQAFASPLRTLTPAFLRNNKRPDLRTAPERIRPLRARLTWALQGAVERDELHLCYQPQADLASGRITAVEALLRWKSPEFGTVSPDVFIPLAEESGAIVEIGEWVLREACAQAKAWYMSGLPPIRVAVNLSVCQVLAGKFVPLVGQVLGDTGLSASLLDLELTEGFPINDTEQLTGTLHALRSMGLRIALDDFGTGNASLSHLLHFPVHKVKIDRSFLRNAGGVRQGAVIVEGIVAMAHGFGLTVVAEGVESEADLEFLRRLRCDEVQGFLLSKPVAATEITHLLRAGGALCRGWDSMAT